jgi:hypothetical protein
MDSQKNMLIDGFFGVQKKSFNRALHFNSTSKKAIYQHKNKSDRV